LSIASFFAIITSLSDCCVYYPSFNRLVEINRPVVLLSSLNCRYLEFGKLEDSWLIQPSSAAAKGKTGTLGKKYLLDLKVEISTGNIHAKRQNY
jgi:hypothetical protein